MIKDDERQLFSALKLAAAYQPFNPIRIPELADGIGMNEKRAWRIVEKWNSKGIIDYGVSPNAVWLTPEGAARENL